MSQHIFLIAGEVSGDALGGPLMEALRRQNPAVRFSGVGGEKMQAAGLTSLLPMQELCVMGIIEVIEHLPRLLKLINWVVEQVEAAQPDVLVTIDLPDFNFRVAKLLKRRGVFKGKIIHYVAPTVWAWRPERAKQVAQYLDGMMCLFPFEPAYFTAHGLRAEYVGHPLTQRDLGALNGSRFREKYNIAEGVPTLLVMFGSRESEISQHGDVFIEAIDYVAEQIPDLELIVPTLPHVEYDVLAVLNKTGVPARVTLDQDEKWHGMAAANAGLAVSGTAALELAYAGVPHVVCYKTNPLTWALVRLLVKTRFAHLANILLDRQEAAVPEFLQLHCDAPKIAAGLLKLLKDKDAVALQAQAFSELRQKLATEAAPSELAARFVLK